jgi:hypothetical protein
MITELKILPGRLFEEYKSGLTENNLRQAFDKLRDADLSTDF